MVLMFRMARLDLGVAPLTKSRSTYLSFPSFTPGWRCSGPFFVRFMEIRLVPTFSSSRSQIQPNQHSFSIGQVANYFSHGFRQFPDQGWNGEDLVAAGQGGIFEKVHDFNAVFASHMLLADAFQISQRCH